jgi:predicted RNA-binding protein
MFPYKSNAFHAYETKKPIKLSKLMPLITIAVVLGVFAFNEARAEVLEEEDCNFVEYFANNTISNLRDALTGLGNASNAEDKNAHNNNFDTYRNRLAQWASIFNAFCK